MDIERKNIKGELLNDARKVAERAKKHDIKPIEGHSKPEHKPSKMSKAKKVFSWIKRTVAGETKVGEGIHGVLDLLPIPNQIIAKAASYFTKGEVREARQELRKLISVRNAIALVAFVLFITGVISLEDLRNLLQAIGEFI